MIEPIGFYVGSPTDLPMYEVVQWLFERHYGKIDECVRRKRLMGVFVHSPISSPDCTSIYNKKEEGE